jgi:hypothetical protein
MRRMLLGLIASCVVSLAGCLTIPDEDAYENPVLSNHRRQYLAQHQNLPADIRHAIASKKVVAGMSRNDVMAAWGPPRSCSRVMNDPAGRTVCLYADTSTSVVLDRRYRDTSYKSVYFEGGRVVDWQFH